MGIIDSFVFAGYAFENDSTANASGLLQSFFDCVFPNETCDIAYLNFTLYNIQYAFVCYLAYAESSNLTDEEAALLSDLIALNETAFNASTTGDCATL